MINRNTPTLLDLVQGKNVRKITCGEAHTAFLSDRDVYTFGDGSHGALGHGNSKSQLFPKVCERSGSGLALWFCTAWLALYPKVCERSGRDEEAEQSVLERGRGGTCVVG